MSKLNILYEGDKSVCEKYLLLAKKKLEHINAIGRPRKTIALPEVTIEITDCSARQEILIAENSKIVKYEEEQKEKEEFKGLVLQYGIGYEALVLTDVQGVFVPNIKVFCSDGGSGIPVFSLVNILLGDFTMCWEEFSRITQNSAIATLLRCEAFVYKYTYIAKLLKSTFDYSENSLMYADTPADIVKRQCKYGGSVWQTHTITCGNLSDGYLTVTAVEYQPYIEYGWNLVEWVVCAKFNGIQVTFDGANTSVSVLRIKILFDCFMENNIFYVTMIRGANLVTYKLNVTTLNFEKQEIFNINTTIDNQEGEQVIAGLHNFYYYMYYVKEENITLYVNKYLFANKVDTKYYSDIIQIETDMWNPYLKALYIAYTKQVPDPAPPYPPFGDIQCEMITMNITGLWCSCEFSCLGDLLYSEGAGCEYGAEGIANSENWGITEVNVGGYTLEFKYLTNWDQDGNVTVLAATHYTIPILAGLSLSANNDFLIVTAFDESGKSKPKNVHLFGGIVSASTGSSTYHIKIAGNAFASVDSIQNTGPICSGREKNYILQDFVFTSSGFCAQIGETNTVYYGDCSAPIIINSMSRLGDIRYLPAASAYPYDHNWTQITYEGLQDLAEKPVDPILMYATKDASKVFLQGQETEFTYLSEPANRAFIQYVESRK